MFAKMKKMTACALAACALCLALAPGIAWAGEAPGVVLDAVSYTHLDVYKRQASRSAVAPPAGELRVTLTEGRPAATAGTAYEVALADSDGVQVGAQQLNLSLEGDSWSVARFDGLADGSYTLSVRAPGIAPYSQKIDVKGDSSAVELYVGDLAADPQAPARIRVLVPCLLYTSRCV